MVEVLFYIITGCPCSSYRLDSTRPNPRWMIKVTHWDDSVEPKGMTVRRRRDYRLIECLLFSSPSSPSITSCPPNLPNPYLPPTDATRMFDLVYPTIQRNKSSNISGQDESDREWFFRSAGSGFLPFFFRIRDLMWFSLLICPTTHGLP